MKTIFDLLFALVCTILFPTFICDSSIAFSNSIFSLGFTFALFVLFQYARRQSYSLRMNVFTKILGFLFSVMTAYGYSLENTEVVWFTNLKLIFAVLVYTHVYSQLLSIIWIFLEKAEEKLSVVSYGSGLSTVDNVLKKLLDKPLLLMAIFWLFWMPCYISTFPGGFKYDATNEFEQLTNGYSGDFPLLHSFIITRMLSIGYSCTGSYNTGIAIYTIVQMLLMSAMFAHILYVLHKQFVNHILLGVLAVYYAAFPVIHILVTCTVRDVLFSGLLTYAMFLFYQMALDFNRFMCCARKPIGLAFVLTLTFLSRNNNTGPLMPIILVVISIAVGSAAGKHNFKGSIVFAVFLVGSYLLISAVLTVLCQPLVPAKSNSALSLFSQSIVRAYLADNQNWSQEEKDTFTYYVRTDDLTYVAENGDSTKFRLRINDGEIDAFLLFWIKIGIKIQVHI